MAWMPTINDWLVIELPGESNRAVVRKIVNDDIVTCEIVTAPLGKTPHSFRLKDMVNVKREPARFGSDKWVAMLVRFPDPVQKPERKPKPPQAAVPVADEAHKRPARQAGKEPKVKRRIAM